MFVVRRVRPNDPDLRLCRFPAARGVPPSARGQCRQVDRSLATEDVYALYVGDAMRVAAADRTATYDLRVDNVVDGYNPRVAEGTEQDDTARFLINPGRRSVDSAGRR